MIVTTSRRAARRTKELARAVGAFVGVYAPRGTKSIEEIVERARSLGHATVAIFEEERRRPAAISFIRVEKGWDWIGVIKILHRGRIPKLKPRYREIKFVGEGRYRKFFDFPEPKTDDFVLLTAKEGKIKFSYKRHKLTFDVIG